MSQKAEEEIKYLIFIINFNFFNLDLLSVLIFFSILNFAII